MKKVKISQHKLELHPMIVELTATDFVNLKTPPDINLISETQLSILLDNIQLNVIKSASGEYLLLAPNLQYNFLISHPAAENMSVRLSIYTPRTDSELVELIDTLSLVLPSLSFLEFPNKSKTINARYKLLKKMGYKPTALTILSQLANKSKSTFSKRA